MDHHVALRVRFVISSSSILPACLMQLPVCSSGMDRFMTLLSHQSLRKSTEPVIATHGYQCQNNGRPKAPRDRRLQMLPPTVFYHNFSISHPYLAAPRI